jgi:NitT/TauT family transport system ATP-binding protein
MIKEQATVMEVENISMSFKSSRDADVLAGVRFSLHRGEVVGIRGENGSGKTTLLNIIAGIEKPTTGSVGFSRPLNQKLDIGVVFQNYNSSLLPWLTAEDNICIPLKIVGAKKKEIKEKLERVLTRLKFEKLPLKNYPKQLSGGQKQKVAIARGMIREPDILLMDEPFSNLDFQTSLDLQEVIQHIQLVDKTSVIIVSHDLDNVIFLADRIVVLSGHPSTISKEFTIGFSRPRRMDILFSEELKAIRNKILDHEYRAFKRNMSGGVSK